MPRRIIRSEEHTSELQSHDNLVCRLLLEKNTTASPPSMCRAHAAPSTRAYRSPAPPEPGEDGGAAREGRQWPRGRQDRDRLFFLGGAGRADHFTCPPGHGLRC